MNIRSLLLICFLTSTALQPILIQGCCQLPFSFDTLKTNISTFFSNTKVRIGIAAVGLTAGALYAYHRYARTETAPYIAAPNNRLPNHIQKMAEDVFLNLQEADRDRKLKSLTFSATDDPSHSLPRQKKINLNRADCDLVRMNSPLFGNQEIIEDHAYFNMLRILYHEAYHLMLDHSCDANSKISALDTYFIRNRGCVNISMGTRIRHAQEMAAELGARYCLHRYHDHSGLFSYHEDDDHPTRAEHEEYIYLMLSWFRSNENLPANVVQFLTQSYWNNRTIKSRNPYAMIEMPTYGDYLLWCETSRFKEANDSFEIRKDEDGHFIL